MGGRPAFADNLVKGWSLGMGCPGSGSSFIGGNFSSSTVDGFEGTGQCTRTSTRFTKMTYQSHSGGALSASTNFGLHTGDVMVLPPQLSTDTSPVFAVAPSCPWVNKSLNFIYADLGQGQNTLSGVGLLGQAVYSTTAGISVQSMLDIASSAVSGTLSLAGSCVSGIYTLSGSGDRGGKIYFTYTGAGFYKSSGGHGLFFLPHQRFVPSALLNLSFSGMQYSSISGDPTYQVRVLPSGGGTTLTVEPYSDAEAGTFSGAFTDVITLTKVNDPYDGVMFGTVTRASVGSGRVACIAASGLSTRVICTGESPADNRYSYSLVFASDPFVTLGQATPMSQVQYEVGFRSPSHLSSDGTHFFVVDSNNNRVLMWNSDPISNPRPDIVFGQPSLAFHSSPGENYTASTLSSPTCAYSDGTHVFICDNGRLLIWNSIPTANGTPADVVLGQADMTTYVPDSFGTIDGKMLCRPSGVVVKAGKLYVLDNQYNRILVWNSVPTQNNVSADWVLGQADFTGRWPIPGGSSSASNFYYPSSMTSDGTRLVVADTWNHRTLIWDTIPTAAGTPASHEVGQYDWDYNYLNWPSLSAQSSRNPHGAFIGGGSLFVADSDNGRVLIYDHIPSANWDTANVVLGQTDGGASNGSATLSSQSLGWPEDVLYDGTHLFVADSGNSRILVWNGIPTANYQAADAVIGQSAFTSGNPNGFAPTANTTTLPSGVYGDGTRLLVSDSGSNRVLLWTSLPSSNGGAADLVLGQGAMNTDTDQNLSAAGRLMRNRRVAITATAEPTQSAGQVTGLAASVPRARAATRNPGSVSGSPSTAAPRVGVLSVIEPPPSAQSLSKPGPVFLSGNRIAVSDINNHRVLIWNSLPSTNHQAADIVLGKDSMTTDTTSETTDEYTLSEPGQISWDGSHFLVADPYQSRVLIWNGWPTASHQAADMVLGQVDFTHTDYGDSGPDAQSLSFPEGVFSDGTHLIVADTGNNRVLIWNHFPTVSQQAADVVLGQADFSGGDYNGLSAKDFGSPWSVWFDGTRLYVADLENNRVLIWSALPQTDYKPASYVLGQPDFTSNTAGLSEAELNHPNALFVQNNIIWVADGDNNRIVRFERP